MAKISKVFLCLLLTFCFLPRTLYAQDEVLISAKPLPVIAVLLPYEIPSRKLSLPPQTPLKDRPFISVDVPVLPFKNLAGINGIENQPFGQVAKSEEKNISARYSLWPKISFYSRNIHTGFYGSSFSLHDGDRIREDFQAEALVEGSVWVVLFGAEGFGFEEKINSVLSGDGYRLDFKRLAYSVDGWGGVKFGSFSRSFIAVRFGKGLICGKGEEQYVSSVLTKPLSVPTYSQSFEFNRGSVEARWLIWHFAPSAEFQVSRYKRSKTAEGYFGFKDKDFRDSRITARFEAIPSVKHDNVRVLVERTEFFGSNNRIIFRNEQSRWQAYLRIKF